MEKIDDCGGGGSGGAGADVDADLVSSEAAAPAAAGGGTRGAIAGGSEMEGKNTAEGEPRVKRKMKTAFQLETLEKTYAVETYPSEELRAELSLKLGLSDRQLQMWFCHRRLKDRKPPAEKRQKKEVPPGVVAGLSSGPGQQVVVAEVGNEHVRGSGSSSFGHAEISQHRKVARRAGIALARIGTELPAVKRYYEPPQAISELRAIAFVESQLGERLREDGPILGMEFDPLPPGAFGAPIVPSGQQKVGLRLYDAQVYERPDAKVIKSATRLVHEYQFLPEQPSIRDDIHERATSSHFYSSSPDAQSSRTPLSSGRSFVIGSEQLTSGHSFQGQLPGLNLLPHFGKQNHRSSPASVDLEILPPRTSFVNIGVDAHNGVHPMVGVENPFTTPDRRVAHDEERLERKRKSEEARIAREVEAHEKRIRKELEKQDLLRRKREEQMKKELERQDKERRKEEERLLREKQREEERYQREQRREMEKREKFLQKESLKAEKMRVKEEMRREKEAARLKAANERATARRIAKESMELIDDERLELMELAASSQGLPSLVALDNEVLQNLELLRDKLTDFPTGSVHLKIPFGIQPWTESEDSIGNLLMVWKFLITFADVLGLWPFTLDEFIQSLHDYDSRLLGEIHMALLRTIIKDIEDVARTPATALGANQISAANPGGGHAQIVDGAYAWGFDIRNWQKHLNPLTWPEILRQFALSDGFGPKLKKDVKQASLPDENEGNDSANIISDLRSGIAAENALAKMRRRGISNLGRSRHRLTPGTVKFAAFHVLSLEGSNGLSILEVAEKIQKSGLRDLTTSKTPEASIAAALSRDTKLFERTAPSTYCVRTPYRKDPADTEAILSAALERIQVYKNGCLDAEEAEKEDAERDEDSESDVAEDPDIDDLDTELKPNKEPLLSLETRKDDSGISSGNGKKHSHNKLMQIQQSGIRNSQTAIDITKPETFSEHKVAGISVDCSSHAFEVPLDASNSHQEDNVIDDGNYGELWVQGLIEGEYSDLSVEERLNALVALVGVANEGNSVRIILEERLEAANALKKQIWSEAQLDKRRFKEEYAIKLLYSTVGLNKFDNSSRNSVDGRRSPFLATEGTNGLATTNSRNQEDMGYVTSERNMQIQDFSGPENLMFQQTAYASEKSRSEIKAYIGYRAEEIYVYKSLPLGQDRRHNRYWRFVASPSQSDPGCGRIFVELQDGRWRVIDSVQDFDALLESLDVRGIREFHLHSMLRRIELSFKQIARKNFSNSGSQHGENIKGEAFDGSPKRTMHVSEREPGSSCAVNVGSDEMDKNDTWKRYQEFEKWALEECFNSVILCALKCGKARRKRLLHVCDSCRDTYFFEEHHCTICHKNYSVTSKNFDVLEHFTWCKEKLKLHDVASLNLETSPPIRIRLLKAQLASVEATIPAEALQASWSDEYRKSWSVKLQNASSPEDLLQILTLLEGAIKSDFLSSNFETSRELIASGDLSDYAADNVLNLEAIVVPPWIPKTTAAVALRLMEFDASICYTLHRNEDYKRERESRNIITIPVRHTASKNGREDPHKEHLHEEDAYDASGNMHNSWGRGRSKGRGRNGIQDGGRSQRSIAGSRNESIPESTSRKNDKFGPLSGWKGRQRVSGGHKRGRRTARNRQKPAKKVAKIIVHATRANANSYKKMPGSSHQVEWNEEEPVQVEEGNVSSSGRSGFDDDNGEAATGADYDDHHQVVNNHSRVLSRKPRHLSDDFIYDMGGEDGNDEIFEEEEEDDEEDDNAGDSGEGSEDDGEGQAEEVEEEEGGEEYINGDSDEEGHKFSGKEEMPNLNKDLEFSSSDYSD